LPDDLAGQGALDALARLEADEVRPPRRWALLLLALPIATIIYPPVYNRAHPAFGGLPFFVWYQMVAVIFGGAVTGVVYLLRREARQPE
jgi:hypothetical protein